MPDTAESLHAFAASHAHLVRRGFDLAMLVEAKRTGKWDVDEAKMQIVDYVHKLGPAIAAARAS